MSGGIELVNALGLRDGNVSVFVCDDRNDGGVRWHAAQVRTIRLDSSGKPPVMGVVLGGQGGGEVTEVGMGGVRVKCQGDALKFKSVKALAQFAGKGGRGSRRFFVAQLDGSYVVAHNIKLSSSSSSAAAGGPSSAPNVCHVSPGNAPQFAPFDIHGPHDILARVTKRPPAFKSLVMDKWASQGRRGDV